MNKVECYKLNENILMSLIKEALKGCKEGEERELGVVIRKVQGTFYIENVENLKGIKGLIRMMDSEKYKMIESMYKKENKVIDTYTRYMILGKILEDSLKYRGYIKDIYSYCRVKSYKELRIFLVNITKIKKDKDALELKIKTLECLLGKKEGVERELSKAKEELVELSKNYKILVKKLKTQPKDSYFNPPENEGGIRGIDTKVEELQRETLPDIRELTKHNYVKDEECVEKVKVLAEKGYTKGEIAKELGLSEGTIYNIKVEYGIKIERKSREKVKTSIEEIEPLLAKGFTYKEVASYMRSIGKKGYSVANIEKIVKENR